MVLAWPARIDPVDEDVQEIDDPAIRGNTASDAVPTRSAGALGSSLPRSPQGGGAGDCVPNDVSSDLEGLVVDPLARARRAPADLAEPVARQFRKSYLVRGRGG
jgi:hypothetical protein